MPVVFTGIFVYFFSFYLHTIMCTCPSIFTYGSVSLQFSLSPSASLVDRQNGLIPCVFVICNLKNLSTILGAKVFEQKKNQRDE